jgi:ResB-like family
MPGPFSAFVRFFTSIKLTVVLLVTSIALVFFATIDQVHLGVWGVQAKWFRSFFVWQEVAGRKLPVFPGGFIIGGFLLLNLVLSHLYRFKLSWKKSGITITHAGLILLLIGELLTTLFQEEFQMRLDEGQTSSYAESSRILELAITDVTGPDIDRVVAIPVDYLQTSDPIRPGDLPFTITALRYLPNTLVQMKSQSPQAPESGADRDIGAQLSVTPTPITYNDKERNLPAALIELASPAGKLGKWLVSPWLDNTQCFDYQGRTYSLILRFKRTYKPFTLTLLDFKHDRYPGTDIPKNFSSRLRLRNQGTGEDRDVLVYMNNPLRYAGLTFYQQGFDNNDKTTILQVVRNPGWMIPYISCLMLVAGLFVQFGISLTSFAKRRKAALVIETKNQSQKLASK